MCLYPQPAYLDELGVLKFSPEGSLRIPCGRCSECISKRALEWSTRARHEISLHRDNCFVTLTYNDSSLPSIFLVKDEFQLFMKRLRKFAKNKSIRYMVSHEYGTKSFRPHHHVILFGFNPDNQIYSRMSPKGEKLFTSSVLSKLWTHGFHSIGSANERSAYYIAAYALKGKKHFLTDPNTGELVAVSDCMDSSKRPAIGLEYFRKNVQQLIDSGAILPRYYLKQLEKYYPDLLAHYENERCFKFKNRSSHELLAKHVLDSQKKNLSSEFRASSDDSIIESEHLTEYLKFNRDEYHRLTNGV